MDHMDNYDRASEIAKSLPPEVAEILFCNFCNGQTDPKSLISSMLVCKYWKQCIWGSVRIWELMLHQRWPEISPRTSENYDPEPRWFLDNNERPQEDAKILLNFDQHARKSVKSLQEADTVNSGKRS